MKRGLVVALLAAGILLATPVSAGAWATYCDWDPLVLIVTPSGHVVAVYDSVWTSTPISVGLPVESYTTTRVYDATGHAQTAVDMSIYTPTGLLLRYQVHDMVTTGLLGTGTVYAQANGWSGSAVHLKFTLSTA